MSTIQFERDSLHNVHLHVLPTDRFKTYAITAYIGYPLAEETVTPTALIPFVLRRGNAHYPETIKFREKLDELYGAGFGFDIVKRGDVQMIQFRMDMIEDKYVADTGLLRDALQFMGDTITRPFIKNGSFHEPYVEAEKETLRKRIESIVNDKIRYAAERCIEEMCEGDPYRLHALGERDQIDKIDGTSLAEHYDQWLKNSSIHIYIVGNTSLEEVRPLVQDAFDIKQNSGQSIALKPYEQKRSTVKEVVEELDVTQGKLNMGLSTPVHLSHPNYAAALMYNGILGAFPHSKMFINVREKASLAYYAASRLDGHKGILTIQSGIEIDNYDKAKDIILEQLEAMRNGQISELEMNQTKAMLTNHLHEIQDSAFEMIGFDFSHFAAAKRTPATLIKDIQSVTVEQIQQVAGTVELDTIYFLRDRKEG